MKAPFADAALAALEAGRPHGSDLESIAQIAESVPDNAERLAAAAALHTAAMLDAGRLRDGLQWLEIWIARAPEAAWTFIEQRNESEWRNDARLQDVLGALANNIGGLNAAPALLARMAILAHTPMTADGDAHRPTVRRYGLRDFQRYTFECLVRTPSPAARQALQGLLLAPQFGTLSDVIHWRLDQQAEGAVKPIAWRETGVATFAKTWETPPRTVDELFDLVLRRLESICDDLNGSPWDPRSVVRDMSETELRRWLGERLESQSNGWFSVTQETVVAGENRTDLRLENRTQAGGVVVIEIKVASMRSWGGQDLVDKVETQLVDQYLMPAHAQHGIYLVANLKNRARWTLSSQGQVGYDALVAAIAARIQEVAFVRTELRLSLFDLKINPN